MSRNALLEEIETKNMQKKKIPDFRIGDTIKIQSRIIEGEKERLQTLTGVVISRKGTGISETFSIYRTAYGTAMERIFLIHSPRVSKIEIVKRGKVRRSKLYYLRGLQGKASKIKEQIFGKEQEPEPQEETL